MTRVAVVQAASIPFDSAATVAKAEGLIAECAAGGAELAVFPEAFVGCYPKGTAFGAVVGSLRRAGTCISATSMRPSSWTVPAWDAFSARPPLTGSSWSWA